MRKKKVHNKVLLWTILGFVVALFVRLILLPFGNNNDLITYAGWSEWIYIHGPRGFYENNVWVYEWPTQLPFVNLIYYFNYIIFGKSLALIAWIRNFLVVGHLFPNFAKYWISFETWFGWTYFSKTPYMIGHVLSNKIIPILADIATAIIIFLIGKKHVNRNKAIITALIFLFVPYTIYISALWGQYDQLSALALLPSFYFVYLLKEGKSKLKNLFLPLSMLCLFIAVEVKPTVAFTIPFYIYYVLKQKPKIWNILLTGAVGLGLFYITTIPFTAGNVINYTLNTVIPKVMFAGRNVLSTNVFNFWELISPVKLSSITYTILGIPAIYWGYIFLALLNGLAIYIVSKADNIKTMFLGLFITTGGVYIFATGMLDRYYFAGLLIFLILTMFYKKTIYLWFGAAILFSINLLTSWGYPVNLQLHDIFYANYPVVRMVSFTQTAIFALMVIIGIRNSDEKD